MKLCKNNLRQQNLAAMVCKHNAAIGFPIIYRSGKMGTISLRIPESYHNQLRQISTKEKISINQFINSAIAEKIATSQTIDYISELAKGASREKFLAVLAKVPNTPPRPDDI